LAEVLRTKKGDTNRVRLFDIINEEQWQSLNKRLPELATVYQKMEPFPHMSFDGLFTPWALTLAEKKFPQPSDDWWVYENFMERKWAKDDLTDCHTTIRSIIFALYDKLFVQFLEKLTGIKGLIVDSQLNGGGLHQITEGGKLDIHIDYNYHPATQLDRRLNVLLYLNSNWVPEWKGALELWDENVTTCVQSYLPRIGRLVVFSTSEKSNHGHPEPLQCPLGVTRKSIALYYYSNGRPENEKAAPHSTVFKKRPQDPDDPEMEKLRIQRAIKRIN
jgi:hypothetical protein